MKIAAAQLDPVIGAFEANVAKIREAYDRAKSLGARVCLTPELGVCGYPPHDLIERPEMFDRCEKALEELARATRNQNCALVVGHVARNPSRVGREAQNAVTVLERGERVFRQAKTLLPTYDIFDEARFFEPAAENQLWECDGKRVALAICEDLWANDPAFGRKLYGRDPVDEYVRQKAELVLAIAASPYEWRKNSHREALHGEVARKVGAPLVYVNQVGATDEILFDGASFALDRSGKLLGRLPVFKQALGVLEFSASDGLSWLFASAREDTLPPDIESLRRGLVLGIREYFARTGFKSAIIGVSGGIDSAVVAVLACEALDAKNVLGIAMPSQFSSRHSLEDAEALARNLGMRLEVRPIKFLFSQAQRELSEGRGQLAPVATENLQSRLRGMILMTLANHFSSLVLTTGNKSELATGYCTQYGDMVGALAPIGDLFKVRVYELARHLNAGNAKNPVIPQRILTKPPSAELKPDQKDTDTLPAYEILDPLLEEYIERGTSVRELEKRYGSAKGQSAGWVRDILRRLEMSEFKRRQAAPVLKVSHKAFGIGRRIPIAKTWDQNI